MIKFIGFTVGLLALACGSAEEPQDLGQVEQEIFIPLNYGIEDFEPNLRCDDDWGGKPCMVAKDRQLNFYVDSSNCNPWMKQRMQDAVIDVGNLVRDEGWTVQLVDPNTNWDFVMFCEAHETGPLAHSWFAPGAKCYDTPRGRLCQADRGYVAVRPNYLVVRPIIQRATEQQKLYYNANALRHEVAHMMGIGHLPGTQEGNRLMAVGYPQDLKSPVFNSFLGLEEEELRMLECYNPGRGGAICD